MNSFGPEIFSGSGNKPYGQRISYIGLFTIKRNLSGHAGDGGIWCIINTTNYCRLIKLPFIDLKVDCRRRKKKLSGGKWFSIKQPEHARRFHIFPHTKRSSNFHLTISILFWLKETYRVTIVLIKWIHFQVLEFYDETKRPIASAFNCCNHGMFLVL